METSRTKDKLASEPQRPIIQGKPPFLLPPPPTARKKFSDESLNLNFLDILD